MDLTQNNYPVSFDRTGAVAGILSIISYFGAAVVPVDGISTYLGFAFGPLMIVSFMGIYAYFGRYKLTPALHISYLFGIIAGILVTSLIFIQVANNIWHNEGLASAATEEAEQLLKAAHRGANRVQAALDVAFDIFITVSVILLGYTMLNHPRFGKIIGFTGMLAGSLLLALNLYTFPTAPAEAGLVDAGPLLGVWMLVVFVWLTVVVFRKEHASGSA